MSIFQTIKNNLENARNDKRDPIDLFTPLKNAGVAVRSKFLDFADNERFKIRPDVSGFSVNEQARDAFLAPENNPAVKAGNFVKDVGQGILRSGASVGIDLSNAVTPGRVDSFPVDSGSEFERQFKKILFGEEGGDVESLTTRFKKSPDRLDEFASGVGLNVPEKARNIVAPIAVAGFTALDFTGAGGVGKNAAIKTLSKLDDAPQIAQYLFRNVKGLPANKIDDISEILANTTDPKQIDRTLNTFRRQAQGNVEKSLRVPVSSIETVGDSSGLTLRKITDVADAGVKESKFSQRFRKLNDLPPEIEQQAIQRYDVLSNKETLSRAKKIVDNDYDETLRIIKDSTQPATADMNAAAQLALGVEQRAGNWNQVIDILEKWTPKITQQGQAIQALSMYSKLTPEGALRYGQSLVNKFNNSNELITKLPRNARKGVLGKVAAAAEKLRPGAVKISEEQASAIAKQAQKVQKLPEGEEKLVETALLMTQVHELVPATFWKKVATVQTLAQLLNPKTLIRNIGGNTLFAATENLTDVVGAGLDSAMSLITGKRSTALPDLFSQVKGAKQGLREGIRDSFLGVDTYGVPTQFDISSTPVFKSKVGRFAEKALNLSLRAPDRAMYKAAYDGSLYKQMKAAGVPNSTQSVNVMVSAEMLELAHLDGLYRTFQDDNAISMAFTTIKKGLNMLTSPLTKGEFGLGDILLKYPKTPGALLSRGIEYSPLGFLNTVLEMARPLTGRKFNQKKFVEATSRALVGTGTQVGTGALLHRLGILTGRGPDDRDLAQLERETGLGDYKVNVSALKRFVMSGFEPEVATMEEGDRLLSYDWLQPAAIGLAMGANIDENAGVDGRGIVESLLDGTAAGLDAIGDQPLISNLTGIFKFNDFISDVGKDTLKNVPSSFVPTILSQVRQLSDNTSRQTYDPSNIRYAMNLARSRVPGANQSLPFNANVLGGSREMYQNGSNNLFNVFFNPAFTTAYNPTPSAKLVLDLHSSTGETSQIPRVTARTQSVIKVVRDEDGNPIRDAEGNIQRTTSRVELTPTQINGLQNVTGTMTRVVFDAFVQDPQFQALSDEDKIERLTKALTDIGTAGRHIILGHQPSRYTADAVQLIDSYNDGTLGFSIPQNQDFFEDRGFETSPSELVPGVLKVETPQ